MRIARLIWVAFIASVLGGCDRGVSSRGFIRTSTNGMVYSCEVALVDNSDAPVILLSRSGGRGRSYALNWETSRGRLFVDGSPFPIPGVSIPTIIYKERGALKKKAIPKSGVWLPLFSKNGPSLEELEHVFDQIERGE